MPLDVEQQLAALGKFWNGTIAHVEATEIASRDATRSNRSVSGIEGLVAAPTPDQPPGIHPFTEEEATMIDLETPSQTDEHRKAPKRVLLAGLLAAAAVVATALVVIRDDDAVNPADEPSPTVTVPPTTPPRALPQAGGELVPGTYFVDQVSGTATPRIFFTIGDGWGAPGSPYGVSSVYNEFGIVDFSHPVAVYSDACHWEDGYHPGPVDTVDGLVAALSEQQGWAEVTAPSDISVVGYVGKAFQRTALADMSDCSTRFYGTRTSDGPGTYPDIRSWANHGEFGPGSYYEPGEIETLRVLDIDGTVVVISTAVWPGPSAAGHADFAADVLDSIRVERA